MKEERKKKLTLMLVPHNGRGIRSIELSFVFFTSIIVGVMLFVGTGAFFVFKYIDASSKLERSIGYIAERDETLAAIEEEIIDMSEIGGRFSEEIEKTKSFFNNASYSGNENDSAEDLRQGDFAQAFNLSTDNYVGDLDDLEILRSFSKKLEDGLPYLEDINGLVSQQKDIFQDLPVFWPVQGAVVSAEWGPNIHPVYGGWYMHKGIDFAALTGMPIRAVANGEVTFVEYDPNSYGIHVFIAHKFGFKSHYAHMSSLKVRKGQKITQGQIIGTVGATGKVTGSHLHLELFLGNEIIDPGAYLRVLADYDRPSGNR